MCIDDTEEATLSRNYPQGFANHLEFGIAVWIDTWSGALSFMRCVYFDGKHTCESFEIPRIALSVIP